MLIESMWARQKFQRAIRWALLPLAYAAALGVACTDTHSLKLSYHAGTETWKDYPGNPINAPGETGEWDSWAVMSMTVVKVGPSYHLYYEGGASGVADLQIGHAISTDGLTWTKDPHNPVLRPGPEGEWDDGATWDPYVIYEDGQFKLWYGGERKGHRDFQCGYAISRDGTKFAKQGRISNFRKGEIADMHVVHIPETGSFAMFYWDRRYPQSERLRKAVSPDERHFDFDNSALIRIEGEEPGHRYPHVFASQGTWFMYYGFDGGPPRMGYATSRDLRSWRVGDRHVKAGEDPEVLNLPGNLHLLFFCPEGFQDKAGCDIRLALFAGHLGKLGSMESLSAKQPSESGQHRRR